MFSVSWLKVQFRRLKLKRRHQRPRRLSDIHALLRVSVLACMYAGGILYIPTILYLNLTE